MGTPLAQLALVDQFTFEAPPPPRYWGHRGSVNRLEQRITLAGRLRCAVGFAQFPDHDAADAAGSRINNLRLAGVLVIVGNEVVIGRARVINAQVRRLGRRRPSGRGWLRSRWT